MTSYPSQIHIKDFPCNAAVVDITGGVFWNCDGMWLREDALEENIGDFPPGSLGVIDGEIRYVRGHDDWLLIRGLGAPHPHANHPEQRVERPVVLRIPMSHQQEFPFGTVKFFEASTYGDETAYSEEVVFNVPMTKAEEGHVFQPHDIAFTGEMGDPKHQKASIRFKLSGVEQLEPQMQVNIRKNQGLKPFSRKELAKQLAGAAKRLLNAVAIARRSLVCGRTEVTVDNLFLAKVTRVSEGSVQVTLGVII